MLELRLLGPPELWRDGERLDLPRSKKTRALLAYLAVEAGEHRREALGALLWDMTDDPRGALRWSLSKLRSTVGEEAKWIEADRERVALRTELVRVDAADLAAVAAGGPGGVATEELERLAGLARGEFLEGLDLPDLFSYQAWCIAGRERAREALARILGELVARHREDPRRALPFARARTEAEAFDVGARKELLGLLIDAGKEDEARRHYELGRRLFRELGAEGVAELDRAWEQVRTRSPGGAAEPESGERTPEARQPAAGTTGFVGREAERSRLHGLLADAVAGGGLRIAAVEGEPGAGKSRLVETFAVEVAEGGTPVLAGRSYEAESSRAFGPWRDALADDVEERLGGEGQEGRSPASRDALFAAVAAAVGRRAAREGGGVLVLDDVQWMDRDSAELLHFVGRSVRERPLLLVLAYRSGEIEDNEPASAALRGLRREAGVEALVVSPLTEAEIDELVAPFGVEGRPIHRASAGNPLYALELARAARDGADGPSPSLAGLVRDRLERLPAEAVDVLRWSAVLGHAAAVEWIESLSTLEPDELVASLERLEAEGLLRPHDDGAAYSFGHDVVREVVYGGLAHPRRRLMHRRVAELLESRHTEPALATQLAHHAALAGEAMLGVRACIEAGRHALRVFANGEAEILARRGLDLATGLSEADGIAAALELLHVLYSATTPDRDEAAARVHDLAVRALDLGLVRPARLGFQMLSFLRWESASMAAAHDNILQAERVSRSAEPAERAAALAQAARCLVLLERNLEQAEAFVLEAETVGRGAGGATSNLSFAVAKLHEHRGELEEAAAAYRQARWRGRESGDRLAEFRALEHWTMLDIDRGDIASALALAKHLSMLGERVREGAEGPSARALAALTRRLAGEGDDADLDAALADLEAADAKYPLAFVLTRWAEAELAAGRIEAAAERAEAGLAMALAIGRASDIALARALVARCSHEAGVEVGSSVEANGMDLAALSALVRPRVEALLEGVETPARG